MLKEIKQYLNNVQKNKISLEEIQARIAEIPIRCIYIVNNSSKGVKSIKWQLIIVK